MRLSPSFFHQIWIDEHKTPLKFCEMCKIIFKNYDGNALTPKHTKLFLGMIYPTMEKKDTAISGAEFDAKHNIDQSMPPLAVYLHCKAKLRDFKKRFMSVKE